MKVAMVTPMTPESAIADVMLQAVPYLIEKGWDLEIWCQNAPALRPSPVRVLPIQAIDETTVAALRRYDLVVYVLGNSPLHSQIMELARLVPGLVVLHDASITDMVLLSAGQAGERAALAALAGAVYGDEVAEKVRRPSNTDPGAWMRFCADVPLTEWATEHAIGAVVHSQWHAARIDGTLIGDVTVAPLPIPSARVGFDDSQNHELGTLLSELPPDAILVVTVGHVNANRGLDVLLQAVAGDEKLRQVHVWAVGPNQGPAAATALRQASKLGLASRFAAPGAVGDAELARVLSRADIAAALRDPVIEGQSASVMTQMLAGRPVIVFDHAHYSELPDDAVVKIDPAAGAPGIRAAIRNLVKKPRDRERRGEAARRYALTTRSGAAYADALYRAGVLALAAKPHMQLAQDLAHYVRRLGIETASVATERMADITFELFELG
ncbi:glycosyltransferase [Xylanimonas allomyrinae]|uniref:Glycosyltransferase n=1 Tax=Xylanimonas allomyrinae TaxID=2509459 RepID=A0A4P6ELZ2_9MICO|nr:glycosyltransferase [Xylanimonas allomyrinae]QAY63395.1 glycosyltransferase [Xylanimonas allomyrinae]